MIDLKNFYISRIYNSNIEQKFYIYFRNHDTHKYKFFIRIGLTIDDIVYIKVDELKYFNTLYKLISHTLDLLDIKRDIHKIRYQYSEHGFISFDDKYEIMKIYHYGHTLADAYLQDDYITLYEYKKSTCMYEKGQNLFLLDQGNISLITADDITSANKLLEDSKSEILAGINYFNFLTKR